MAADLYQVAVPNELLSKWSQFYAKCNAAECVWSGGDHQYESVTPVTKVQKWSNLGPTLFNALEAVATAPGKVDRWADDMIQAHGVYFLLAAIFVIVATIALIVGTCWLVSFRNRV